MKNVAGSGGKWLDVSADRLPGWIASFAVRHGVSDPSAGSGEALAVAVGDDHVSFTARDGAVAQCYPPFPPAGGMTALLEEVTHCYAMTGAYDFILQVFGKDLESLSTVILKKLLRIPHVRDVQSSVVLATVKRSTRVPLGHLNESR